MDSGKNVLLKARDSLTESTAAPLFVLLGGFLGAGKTTCLVALVEWLGRKGLRCGIVTNDQGDGLVDTASAETTGAAVRQITGGCFCCRADGLIEALRELEATIRPEVFLAEPVGSCTDLVATVLLPLEQVYAAGYRRAPMSVILDGKRAWQHCFGRSRGGEGFSRDVRYIFLKQMEEAEILVVNKADLLTAQQQGRLTSRLERDFPGKRVLLISAREGVGMEAWFERLLVQNSRPEQVMEVDYDRYGKGEALMGWYNARLDLERPQSSGGEASKPLDGNAFLLGLAREVQEDLEAAGVEIAHFKMSLEGGTGLAVVNAVRNGSPPELSSRMMGPVLHGELLINLRAEGAPGKLERIVAKRLKGRPVRFTERAAFRPGMPKPVHRARGI
jgi:G3E family GTPase